MFSAFWGSFGLVKLGGGNYAILLLTMYLFCNYESCLVSSVMCFLVCFVFAF